MEVKQVIRHRGNVKMGNRKVTGKQNDLQIGKWSEVEMEIRKKSNQGSTFAHVK